MNRFHIDPGFQRYLDRDHFESQGLRCSLQTRRRCRQGGRSAHRLDRPEAGEGGLDGGLVGLDRHVADPQVPRGRALRRHAVASRLLRIWQRHGQAGSGR